MNGHPEAIGESCDGQRSYEDGDKGGNEEGLEFSREDTEVEKGEEFEEVCGSSMQTDGPVDDDDVEQRADEEVG